MIRHCTLCPQLTPRSLSPPVPSPPPDGARPSVHLWAPRHQARPRRGPVRQAALRGQRGSRRRLPAVLPRCASSPRLRLTTTCPPPPPASHLLPCCHCPSSPPSRSAQPAPPGDIINGEEFTPEARIPDPWRMVRTHGSALPPPSRRPAHRPHSLSPRSSTPHNSLRKHALSPSLASLRSRRTTSQRRP